VHISIKLIFENVRRECVIYDIVTDNENWLLVYKNNARRGFLALGSNGKIILDPREEKVGPPLHYDCQLKAP
jgi:hypothetical protein